jgi:hypothetical protein
MGEGMLIFFLPIVVAAGVECCTIGESEGVWIPSFPIRTSVFVKAGHAPSDTPATGLSRDPSEGAILPREACIFHAAASQHIGTGPWCLAEPRRAAMVAGLSTGVGEEWLGGTPPTSRRN